MISVNIATHFKRAKNLQYIVDRFREQTVQPDVIRIYANDYSPKIEGAKVYTGDDHADNSKFYWKPEPGEIYFTCDDDIAYPYDYIERTLQRLKDYPECIVTYHGRKLKAKGISYYAGHQWYAFASKQDEDELIDVPGTGVMAFNADYFDASRVFDNEHRKMVDLVVGMEACKQKVEIVALAHSDLWLLDVIYDDSIYLTQRYNERQQIKLADAIWDIKHG